VERRLRQAGGGRRRIGTLTACTGAGQHALAQRPPADSASRKPSDADAAVPSRKALLRDPGLPHDRLGGAVGPAPRRLRPLTVAPWPAARRIARGAKESRAARRLLRGRSSGLRGLATRDCFPPIGVASADRDRACCSSSEAVLMCRRRDARFAGKRKRRGGCQLIGRSSRSLEGPRVSCRATRLSPPVGVRLRGLIGGLAGRPAATLRVPVRVPYGLHGAWLPA
jgi:hypothetical protein